MFLFVFRRGRNYSIEVLTSGLCHTLHRFREVENVLFNSLSYPLNQEITAIGTYFISSCHFTELIVILLSIYKF